MIYKVLYQELPYEVPVRERTKSLYIEGESERKVRKTLSNRNINIEFIQQLEDAHLEYEKNAEDFEVEKA